MEILILPIDKTETKVRLKIAYNVIRYEGQDNLEKAAEMTELDLDTMEMLAEVEERVMEIAQNLIKSGCCKPPPRSPLFI